MARKVSNDQLHVVNSVSVCKTCRVTDGIYPIRNIAKGRDELGLGTEKEKGLENAPSSLLQRLCRGRMSVSNGPEERG